MISRCSCMEKIRIMHQCGHNCTWNFRSFIEDNVGDGLIISPVDLDFNKINKLPESIKTVSIFDPQYYLPWSSKKKLNAYPYFPNVFFNTEEFSIQSFQAHKVKSAEECVNFQLRNDFKYIIIPTFYSEEITDTIFSDLDNYIITPFLDALNKYNCSKPVLLTAIVNNVQLINANLNTKLLNFLTGYPEIDGIYLIPNIKRAINKKRIDDINTLKSLLTFIDDLKSANLEVHIGYIDVEGYLLSIANPDSISIGAYENSRRFGIDKFIGDNRPSPPNARIYSNVLLQWIDTSYIDVLKSMYSNFDNLFENNKYLDLMLRTSYNWHFTKKEPYMHYFLSFSNQIRRLNNTLQERYNDIYYTLITAKQYFSEIYNSGIVFDTASNGEHIEKWITVLNWYAKTKGVEINVQN